MEKDPAAHRKHRPGPGALPSGITPAYLKVASDGAELQRSRSVGGLHQKGDPPVCIRKLLHKELDSEDQGKDPRSDTDDGTYRESLEDDRKKGSQDEVEKMDLKCAKMDPAKSDSEASATGEQDDAYKGRSSSAAEEQHSESTKLDHLLEKQKPSVFVEIDLGDHTEEKVITCAIKEEKRLPNIGDLSEDEIRTSWVCCIPYHTKKKAKENTSALEKNHQSSQDKTPLTQPLVELSGD
uniref:RIKEN cDNA 1700029H14 gene n=1 Tax=Mus spicilegus TaxID=10103 RepID=A0A8C6GI47_MUSSI